MIFSSLLFLFRFLPAVLITYYLVPKKFRNLVLLLFSLVFYAWGEPIYILLMLTSILVSYTGGIVVAAKNAESLRILNEKFRTRELDKRYLCLV